MEASVGYLRPIPDRLFFRIGDVADIIGVKPYVLRFWETEFPMIAPNKSAAGHRVYRRVDVEMVMLIKHLLYQQRYSIEGARNKIREMRKLGLLKESLAELASKIPSETPVTDSAIASSATVTDLAQAAQIVRGEHYLQSSVVVAEPVVQVQAAETPAVSVAVSPAREIAPIPVEAFGLIAELKQLASTQVNQFFRY